MAHDATKTEPAPHPSIPPEPAQHPAPTSTRVRPENNPETLDGAAKRIGAILRNRPELDPGRPESIPRTVGEDARLPYEQSPEPEQSPQRKVRAQRPEPEEPALLGEEPPPEPEPAPEEVPEPETPQAADESEGDQEIALDEGQLAEFLNLPVTVDDEGQLLVKTKIDGKEGTATLQDLLKGYQTDATLSKRGLALGEREREITTKLDQLEQYTTQQHQVLAALLNSAQEALNPFTGVDWRGLKDDDPTQYGVLKADFNDWQQRIGTLAQQALAAYEQNQQVMGQERGQMTSQKAQEQLQALADNIPEWGDGMKGELESYAKGTYGMTDEDLARVSRHWGAVDAFRKAQLYDQGMAKVKDKAVKKLPKVVKPGAKPSKTAVNQATLHDARSRLKKSGSIDDAANYFRELGKRRR